MHALIDAIGLSLIIFCESNNLSIKIEPMINNEEHCPLANKDRRARVGIGNTNCSLIKDVNVDRKITYCFLKQKTNC